GRTSKSTFSACCRSPSRKRTERNNGTRRRRSKNAQSGVRPIRDRVRKLRRRASPAVDHEPRRIKELSEPYSIFTYRYFVYLWPHLSFLAFHKGKCVGTVVCKMGEHRSTFRGYIAMLVVIKPYRGRGIATELVTRSIKVMMESGCEEVTLEAEVTNKGALALYGRLGFIRAKRLFRYYLNGVDAFRLKLLFPCPEIHPSLSMMADKVESHGHHDHIAPEECPEHHHIS
ncbi:hypothetical protein CUMW_192750, partial [Citrus unshiu]